MILLTRRQARGLRGVLRRPVLGITHAGPVPPLILLAENGRLRTRHRQDACAVECFTRCDPRAAGTVSLPLDALIEFAGPDDTPVRLEDSGPGRTAARWDVGGVPQARVFEVPALGPVGPFPDPPPMWCEVDAALLDALAFACAPEGNGTTGELVLLQGRGDGHAVVAGGSGRSVHGGFVLPGVGDVWLRWTPVFAARPLHRGQPLRVARTETHLVLKSGPWTLFLEIQTGVRFPDVAPLLPDAAVPDAWLRRDRRDAPLPLPGPRRLAGGGPDGRGGHA